MDLRHRHHHHHHDIEETSLEGKKSRWVAILTSLSIGMFLTPCLEIEAYYFHAGTIGWTGIVIVSAVYLITTVLVMLILVTLGISGFRKLESHFLEHHEKAVTGLVLIGLGLLALFVEM